MLKASREKTASALIGLGYKIDRSWHFAGRDERTPSAYVNMDGSIHDFGSGFHGDLADFLHEYRGLSKSEALREARRLLDLPVRMNFSKFEKPKEIKSGFISDKFIQQFFYERRQNFKRYSELLGGLLPSVPDPKKRKKIALKYEIGYSIKADRLIMPIRDEKGRIVTLWKYNPFLEKSKKVRFTQGRPRCAFNLADLIYYRENPDEWVIVCEGEKDTLNAIANGLHAVTPGGASEAFEDIDIPLFKGLKVLVVGDYDEAGQQFNERIASQLEFVAKKVKVLDWEVKATMSGIKLQKGFDLTDWLKIRRR